MKFQEALLTLAKENNIIITEDEYPDLIMFKK